MESGGLVQEQPRGAVALQSGTRLGGYELGARLGVGSMGAVYEGVRTEDGKRVAIKVLSAELAKQPAARARFLEEGKLTARVRHPNIVEVIETGEDGDSAFLVMERLDGEDLAQRIRAGAMAVADAVDLLIPVCDAVVTAHRRGITHRDLKPSNIFLTVRDGRTHPIVLDFGIAKQDDGSAPRAGQLPGSGPRVMFGTPYYLAPEQVADHRSAGPASDQYALGVILYECLTGERPYGGDDMDQLFKVIVAGNAPPPRTRRSDIPAELESVVLRAMSPKPGKRFPTVADFGKALLPFASAPAERASAPAQRAATGRRRPPSSPAIEAEAATPSPFNRTLSPESQGESGPWFLAPASPEDSSEETTLPVVTANGRSAEDRLRKTILGFPSDRDPKKAPAREPTSKRAPAPALGLDGGSMSPLELSEAEAPWVDPSAKRRRTRWLAVAGAGAVSVICLIVVVASGGSDPRAVPPSVSTVQTLPRPSPEPSPPAPPQELAKSAPSPATPTAALETSKPKTSPAMVPPDATAKKSEAAPVAAPAIPKPTRASSTRVATAEPAAAPVAAKRQSAPAPPQATNVGRKPATAAPRSVNVATAGEHAERPAPASTGEGTTRERPAPPRARESSSTAVKAHNGVPLLD
jgi:serine/threonine protein kinase